MPKMGLSLDLKHSYGRELRAALKRVLGSFKTLSQTKAVLDQWSWTNICHTRTGRKMVAKISSGKAHLMNVCRFQCSS